jgi:hypothetical protein
MNVETQRTRSALFADIILGAALAFYGALFTFGIVHTMHLAGVGWNTRLLIYVGAATICFVVYTALPTLPEAWRINLALLVLSVTLTIYSTEIFFFLRDTDNTWLLAITSKLRANFDSRSKFEVVEGLRKEGIDAVPFVIPHNLLADREFDRTTAGLIPIAGISGKTTVLCNENGYYTVYEADEHGFNNPRGLYAAGAVDIALIGDSFVQGFCVHPGEDIAGQLRSSGFRTLNLGVGGSGPLLELAALTEYALPYHPKVVLWFYYENDDVELIEEEQSSILREYMTPGYDQRLRDRQSRVDQVLSDYVANKLKLEEHALQARQDANSSIRKRVSSIAKLYDLRQFLFTHVRPACPITFSILPPTQELRQLLATANERVESVNGRMYFVYLPSLDTFMESGAKYRRHHDQVIAAVKSLNIDIIDFLNQIDTRGTDPVKLFAPTRPAHYSVAGYRLLRDVIRERLLDDRAAVRAAAPPASNPTMRSAASPHRDGLRPYRPPR